MSNFSIKNKTNLSGLPDDSKYQYMFKFTPSISQRKSLTMDGDDILERQRYDDLYRNSFNFQLDIILKMVIISTIDTKSFDRLVDEYVENDLSIALDSNKYTGYVSFNFDSLHRISINYGILSKSINKKSHLLDWRVLTNYSNVMYDDYPSLLSMITHYDISRQDVNNVLEFLPVVLSLHDVENRQCIMDSIKQLLLALYSDDQEAFNNVYKNNELKLPMSTIGENVTIDIPKKQIISPLFQYFGLQGCLNNTRGDVLIRPTHKRYVQKTEVDNKVFNNINSVYIYFTNIEDVELFFENYRHHKNHNSIGKLPFNNGVLNMNHNKPTVHQFDLKNNVSINEKETQSSIPIDIKNRKTPYTKSVHGFIELSHMTVGSVDDFLDGVYDDDIKEHVNNLQNLLQQLSCNVDVYTYNRRNISLMSRKNEFSGVRINNKNFINNDFLYRNLHKGQDLEHSKNMIRHTMPFGNGYVHYTPVITPYIPITIEDGSIDNILRLVQRYKLMGKIGDFKISNVIFAPYSTPSEEVKEQLIDILKSI